MNPMLTMANKAAQRAGQIIIRGFDRRTSLSVQRKTNNDYVSEIDCNAEQAIIDTLLTAYPDHSLLGEENGLLGNKTSDYQWIIDPLDGTTNFLHGFPQFAVSIALKHKNQLSLGVIYDPVADELFSASRGNGAYLNNRRIRVTGLVSLQDALLGTGFPFRQETVIDNYLCIFKQLFLNSAGIRRAGSAALDLAYLAAGRLDGFWEYSLKPWDIAAGALLIREAGGFITDNKGEDNYFTCGNVVAGNPKIFAQLLDVIRRCEQRN
jgi:myo-inositol-1(or 4)-monophosphatase